MTKILDVGNKAPNFAVANQESRTISLDDLAGNWAVVYFYPRASTPGCTNQACGIRDTKKKFDKSNTVILGISPDAPKKLMNFTEKKDLNFSLLSDEDHKIAEKYGVWGLKKFMGREYIGISRITYIIDEQGIIEKVYEKVKTTSHAKDILNDLG